MRKFVKIMLITAAVLGVLGIGLSVAGAALGADQADVDFADTMKDRFGYVLRYVDFHDWDDDDDRDEHETDSHDDGHSVAGTSDGNQKTYQIDDTERIANLEIDLTYDELILEAYSGKDIKVEVKDDDAGNVKVRTDSDTLKITSTKKNTPHRTISVYYPEDMKFAEAEIEVGAGNISMNSDFYAGSLEVYVGAGEFKNSASVTANDTSVEVGTGNIELSGLDTKLLEGECGMGAMTLKLAGKESDYSYKLECGVGNIQLGSQSYSGLGREKTIQNPGASREVNLECGMGEISVIFLD